MMKHKKSLIFIWLLLIAFTGCNTYEKLLKGGTLSERLTLANKLYEAESYSRAKDFYESIIPEIRGTENFEEVFYRYAYCHYYLEDYLMAAYYFKDFATRLPRSKYAENALFMAAYCKYLSSPEPTLDQSITLEAINDFQLFVNKYPTSSRLEEANQYIDELKAKIEKKDFFSAYLYFKIEEYKAAITAFNNFLKKYPFSSQREDALYYLAKASYLYAINSIQSKKVERLQEALRNITYFQKQYPSSHYLRELQQIQESIQSKIEKEKSVHYEL